MEKAFTKLQRPDSEQLGENAPSELQGDIELQGPTGPSPQPSPLLQEAGRQWRQHAEGRTHARRDPPSPVRWETEPVRLGEGQ